ncbi:MAG: outer membrane beta-barrel protein [Magnetococcus sp. YQC-3]
MKAKKFFALSSALLLLGVVETAQTAEGGTKPFYASLKLGSSMPRDMEMTGAVGNHTDMDKGFALSGAVGMQLQQSMRLELELSTRKADISRLRGGAITAKGDLTTKALLGNLYYDFTPMSGLQPYLGAGLGFGRHEISLSSTSTALNGDKRDNTLLYHVGLGMSYRLGQNTSADLGYRYMRSTDIEVSSVTYDFATHELMAGLRLDF